MTTAARPRCLAGSSPDSSKVPALRPGGRAVPAPPARAAMPGRRCWLMPGTAATRQRVTSKRVPRAASSARRCRWNWAGGRGEHATARGVCHSNGTRRAKPGRARPRRRDAIRLAVLLGADRVVAMAGCPPAMPGDRAPHFGAGGWLPYLEGVYERQWASHVEPYWSDLRRTRPRSRPGLVDRAGSDDDRLAREGDLYPARGPVRAGNLRRS